MRNKKQVISLMLALIGSIATSPASLKAASLSATNVAQGSRVIYDTPMLESLSQSAEQRRGNDVWHLSEYSTGSANLMRHLTNGKSETELATIEAQEVPEAPDLTVPPVTTETPKPITPTMPPITPIKPDITVPTLPPVTIETPKPITPTAPPIIPVEPDISLPTVEPPLPETPDPITPIFPTREPESLGQGTKDDKNSKKAPVEKSTDKGVAEVEDSASHAETLPGQELDSPIQSIVPLEEGQAPTSTEAEKESQVEKEAVRKHSIAVNAASAGGAVTGVCASALFLSILKKLSWLRQFFGR